MTTPALAAARAVAVLNHFTANPRRAFTLSELCSALEVSLASMSAVLRALTDAGYLVRHPRHKTYEIGPALVAAGDAASIRHPVIDLARPEMRRLAEETGSECVGSAVVGDEILILALEGRPSARSQALWLGQRLPMLPPMGEAFLAWGQPGQVSDWLSALQPGARQQVQSALDMVRQRGYSVHPTTDELTALNKSLVQLAEKPADSALRQQATKLVSTLDVAEYELMEIDSEQHYRIQLMTAPVFGADGSVIFSITLNGERDYAGRDIIRIGEQLAAAGRGLTRELGGRPPKIPLGEGS